MQAISRRLLLAAGAAALALPGPGQAQQDGSTRPIRIIVAYPAGGVSDVIARALADKLTASLGKPVVVENKAGASGTIGMDAVAKAAPDGHTFGFAAISPLVLSPHLARLPYDARQDVLPVVSVMYSPVLLLATPASDSPDFRALLDAARTRPGAVRWATSGTASLGHIMLEQIASVAKVQLTHVPYKGGGQQITDALGGQFEVLSTNASPAILQHVKAGRLRVLAVGAPARLDSLPGVPTLAELGHGAGNLSSLFGLFAPARTPAPIVERINAEVNKALALPDLRGKLTSTDNVPTGGSAADFARAIAAEYDNNGRIIQASRIRVD